MPYPISHSSSGTPIPWPFVIFLGFALVLGIVLHRTWIGRQVFAIGKNKDGFAANDGVIEWKSVGGGGLYTRERYDNFVLRLEWKIKAGAEFMITQPVFDPALLEGFMKRIEPLGLPLICGIWPLVSYRDAEFMNNEVPGAKVPSDILDRMRRATTQEEGFREGVAIAKETYDRLKKNVAGVQLSAPLGRIEGIFTILE